MLFTIETLRAKRGDCLMLHVGDADAPTLILIDGGWRGVYKKTLRKRLDALKDARTPDDPLPIRLLMVSHIDDDHIKGILDLGAELDEARLTQGRALVRVENLWHNSFDDIVGEHAPELFEASSDDVGTAALTGAIDDDLPGLSRPAAAVLANVPQGRDLRNHAQALGWPVNQPGGGLIVNRADGAAVDPPMVEGLETIVVAPSFQRLRELQIEWDKQLRDLGLGIEPEVTPTAYVDKSVANLASIVVLMRAASKELLLTGDARGDDILAGLADAGLLDDDGARHIDVFKLPHHGSDRNVEEDLFRRITADHYVVSGDGSHGNPDLETFRMLFAGRAHDDRPYTLHLTYALDDMRAHRGHPYPKDEVQALFDEQIAASRLLDVVAPADGAFGMLLDLGEPYTGA